VGARDAAPPAQPHQRAAGLHALAGLRPHARSDPGGDVPPARIIGWVRDEPLVFAPGSRYAYSKTDNIVVGLMAQAGTRKQYGQLLRRTVFGPARLRDTSFSKVNALPRPFLHGFVVDPGAGPEGRQHLPEPERRVGLWGDRQHPGRRQRLHPQLPRPALLRTRAAAPAAHFIAAAPSSPPGPGRNATGLAIFRYRTRCGTVYGHTGNFPGYTQFAAATLDGRRAVTTTLNIPAPAGALLRRLRTVQTTAVCALLGR
jgi:D-alanyl-D-alanine carboxypeptidase